MGRIRMPRTALLFAVAAALATPAPLITTPAHAAPSGGGQVTLFRNPDFTGSAFSRSYTDCAVTATLTGSVGSFDNRPPAGCSVALQSRPGSAFVLCAGRGVVPTAFRQAGRIVIKPGTTPLCAVTSAA